MALILGIDPGTLRLGFGLIDGDPSGARCLNAGTISLPASWKVARRLAHLYHRLVEIFAIAKPECVAMETPFFAKNVQSMLRLGEARGLVIAIASSLDLPLHDYTPAMVKKSVAGSGSASKHAVARMVTHLIHGVQAHDEWDRTDALAIALCHWNRMHRSRGRDGVLAALRSSAPERSRWSRARHSHRKSHRKGSNPGYFRRVQVRSVSKGESSSAS